MKKLHALWQTARNEKTPLTLLVLAQAYVVFIWLAGMNKADLSETLSFLTVLFAVLSAISLDLLVVTTTFSKYRSPWSMLTSIVALVGSILIVIDLFYHNQWYWLHAVFPVMVFMYSQHLAAAKIIAETAAADTIPSSVIEYRMLLIRRMLLKYGYSRKTEIKEVVGGKAETTIGLIETVAIELGLIDAENV